MSSFIINNKCIKVFLPLSPRELEDKVKKIHPCCKPSTIDKLCLLLGEVYKISLKQKNGEGCFEVGAAWAEELLSIKIRGLRALKFLCFLGIIIEHSPHRASIRPKAKTYRFLVRDFKEYELTLSGKAAEKAKESGKRSIKRKTKDPVFSWREHSLNLARLCDSDLLDYRNRSEHKRNAEKFAKGIRLHKWDGWSIVCSMPEDLRERLYFLSEGAVMSVDISSSFAVMLSWLFAEDIENGYKGGNFGLREKMIRDEECHNLRRFLSCDDFYHKLLPDNTRDEAKDFFQVYLNSKNLFFFPLAREIRANFEKMFPACARMVARRQCHAKDERDKSKFWWELYGRQKKIIDAVILKCRDEAIPCIPVHDEIIVPFLDGHKVRDWILQEIYEKTGVSAKAGGKRFEFIDGTVASCNQDNQENLGDSVVYEISSPSQCSLQN